MSWLARSETFPHPVVNAIIIDTGAGEDRTIPYSDLGGTAFGGDSSKTDS